MTKVRYEEMLPHQVRAAREKCPVAYLPIGGIEWHGEHNCLGLDTVKAHALCMRAAEAGGGLVMPALFWGEPREMALMEANHDPEGKIADKMGLSPENFAPGYMHMGSILDQCQSYVRLLFHIFKQLESLGFKVIFILTGHYPLIHFARFASFAFMRDSSVKVICAIGYDLVTDLGYHGDHAAKWETSLMLALRPDLVDLSRLPQDRAEKLIGVGGEDPRDATREFGEEAIQHLIKRMNEKVQQALGSLQA